MAGVYLDHNSTTPLDPRVEQAMRPWLGASANPASIHGFGQAAREAVEEARAKVAELLGAAPAEIVFTASVTEANNAVLASCGRRRGGDGEARGHLVLSALEHPSVAAPAERLEAEGLAVSRVAPGAEGRLDAGRMLAALREETRLLCLMLAHNELGTLQPVAEVAAGCRRREVPVLCDAAQAIGRLPVALEELGVDYLTLGAHKFYGPQGAAALWIRRGAPFEALLLGGGQERRRRAGTVNVPAVVGLGEAARLAAAELEERAAALAALRDRFEAGLEAIPETTIHGRSVPRLPNTSHVAFGGVDGEALLIRLDLDGYAVSTGSACTSGTVEPSRSLLAMGLTQAEALSSLRVSFGAGNTAAQVDSFLAALARHVAALRRLAPAGEPVPSP